MPDLIHTLQKHDMGFLRMVASTWGIELAARDVHSALPVVVKGILNHPNIEEWMEALPEEAQHALSTLVQNEGRMPWAAFCRQFGELRHMGVAKRDRERPDLKPAWTTELLFYRALIGRDFLAPEGETELQEYAYIPEDLVGLLPRLQTVAPPPPGRPATPLECASPWLVKTRVLDDACTLLAALRLKMSEAEIGTLPLETPAGALKGLLAAARLLDYDGMPHPETTRAFLEAPRGRALAQLAQAWMEAPYYNDLRMIEGLKFEGEWENDPQRARRYLLEMMSQVPENQWWNLASFVSAIHDQNPDFQRPAGDYDSWFIRQESTGNFLRGFATWDEVDGALIRSIISGPMHWLGLVDLAAPEPNTEPTAFRLSSWAAALWHGDPPEDLPVEEEPLKATADGKVRLQTLTPRVVRYQVARFCQWERAKAGDNGLEYNYRITPQALERAKSQGLRPAQLLGLLKRHNDGPFPPSLTQALERWEQSGTQATLERLAILRVTTAETMAALRKGRAARCLGDALNETTAIVRPGMEEQLLSALAEAGYLAAARLEGVFEED